MSKLGLGKGLSSLLGSDEGAVFGEELKDIMSLDISQIEANKSQPRTNFAQEPLEELAQSIREHGVISPLIVRKNGNKYQIIAGERRYRASKIAGLTEVPVRIIVADDKKVAEIALIENLQREDLNPLEEALGYKELMKKHSMTQEEVSKSVGKSRSAIANTTRILSLNTDVLNMIKNMEISLGHARAILSIRDAERHTEAAQYIVQDELNVRKSEEYAKCINKGIDFAGGNDEYIDEIGNKVQESLCRKVKVTHSKNKNKGKIELEYFDKEDFKKLMDVLLNIKM